MVFRLGLILRVFVFAVGLTISVPPVIRGQETSLSLEQAMDLARQRAPVILAARGRIEEGRGRLAGALVRFRDNPLVELDAGPRFLPEGRLAAVDVDKTYRERSWLWESLCQAQVFCTTPHGGMMNRFWGNYGCICGVFLNKFFLNDRDE